MPYGVAVWYANSMTSTMRWREDGACMRLISIGLRNFRCFPEIELALHPKLNLLVARNGGGKTALLDAAAILLSNYVARFNPNEQLQTDVQDCRLAKVRSTQLHEMEPQRPMSIECKAELSGKEVHWSEFNGRRPAEQFRQVHMGLVRTAEERQQRIGLGHGTDNVLLPVIAYYRTDRFKALRITESEDLGKPFSRIEAYSNAFNASADTKLFEQWFEYLCKADFEEKMLAGQEASQHQENEFGELAHAIRNAIDCCLEPSGWKQLDYRARYKQLVMTHDQLGTLPIDQLSDGIRNIVGLVGDLASRASRLNPQLRSRAVLETPGVVLIDEIDLHLHPEWQQTIVPSLREAFPEVQFLITTHSPDVVSTARRECVQRLVWNTQEMTSGDLSTPAGQDIVFNVIGMDAETEGERVSSVASDVFGVGPRPDLPIVRDMERYRSLVDQGLYDTEEATVLRDRLVAHYGAEHEELMAAEVSIAGQRARRAARGA